MQISNFFKILNKKIADYDNIAQNPFLNNKSLVLVWIEDCEHNYLDEFNMSSQEGNE